MSTHDAPTVRKFNPKDHPWIPQSYHHISSVPISPTHKLISFAGQVGIDASRPHPLPLADQIRNALHRVDLCLASAGVTKADIVSVRQYLVKFGAMSVEEKEARMEIYAQWLGVDGEGPGPPLTLIGVDSLYADECLFEMEVVCVGTV